jgi:hypothetical protein
MKHITALENAARCCLLLVGRAYNPDLRHAGQRSPAALRYSRWSITYANLIKNYSHGTFSGASHLLSTVESATEPNKADVFWILATDLAKGVSMY